METVFISELRPFLDAVAAEMELYVPNKSGECYVFSKYDASAGKEIEFNNVRTCMPAKEFLFPLRELAAAFPKTFEPKDIKPFAVYGLKDCDLRSIEILDKVFTEEDFVDPLYTGRRKNMFIISSDCIDPVESCFCNLFGGQPFAGSGFDLNASKVKGGFVIEAGSDKGEDFLEKHSQLFSAATGEQLGERDEIRSQSRNRLEEINGEFKFDVEIKQIVENSGDSEIFDDEAQSCVECQGCTRICPTCHCFYLYDSRQDDYFTKMKMWDSCMRMSYAAVAGGANPHKVLGDRVRHRLFHKFVYFLDRYGINMCVGCGRCIDTCAGGMDTRAVLKKLSEEFKNKGDKAKVAK